jgi:CDP-diacylglycerol--glycerol-3-phosphate 3-phosphatidyltransferase
VTPTPDDGKPRRFTRKKTSRQKTSRQLRKAARTNSPHFQRPTSKAARRRDARAARRAATGDGVRQQRIEAMRAAAQRNTEAMRAAAQRNAEAVRQAAHKPAERIRQAAADHPPKPDALGDPSGTAGIWNIANGLTLLRVLLVPVFIWLLFADGGHDPVWRAWAWMAFAVASISDLFDGKLARKYNLVTDFGKLVDPIADKALMGAALIGLSTLGDLPWWITVVILAREIGITLLRFWVIRHGVIPASRGGKAKTMLQGLAIAMYILVITGPLATGRAWVMGLAVLATAVTGLDYIRQALVLRRTSSRARAARRQGREEEVTV